MAGVVKGMDMTLKSMNLEKVESDIFTFLFSKSSVIFITFGNKLL